MFKNPEILRRIEASGAIDRIGTQQGRVLSQLLSEIRLQRLVEYEALANGAPAYTVADLLEDLRGAVWTELEQGDPRIDVYRRNLQRQYLAAADRYLSPSNPGQISDARPIVRSELQALRGAVQVAMERSTDRMTALHLEDLEAEIGRIMDPRSARPAPGSSVSGGPIVIPFPLPFDPEGWMEMLGLEHPEGWMGVLRDEGSEGWDVPVAPPAAVPPY